MMGRGMGGRDEFNVELLEGFRGIGWRIVNGPRS